MRLYFICLIFIFNLPACNNSGGEDTPVPDNDSAKAPVIMGLDARIPGAEEPRLYIDALGKNLDSRDLQATLINDSQEITLEVAAQSFDNARFYLPDSADVAEGLFNLFISNAYGQTHGSVTVLKGDKGDQGDTGPTGPPGEKGDPGSPGEKGDPGIFSITDIPEHGITANKLSFGQYRQIPVPIHKNNVEFDVPNLAHSFPDNTSAIYYNVFPPSVSDTLNPDVKFYLCMLGTADALTTYAIEVELTDTSGAIILSGTRTEELIQNGACKTTTFDTRFNLLTGDQAYTLTIKRMDANSSPVLVKGLYLTYNNVIATPQHN